MVFENADQLHQYTRKEAIADGVLIDLSQDDDGNPCVTLMLPDED